MKSGFYVINFTPSIIKTEYKVFMPAHCVCSTIQIFDFGRSGLLENAFLSVQFTSIHQRKYGWY